MLSRPNRLTASRLFTPTVRRGSRAGTRAMVLHLEPSPPGREREEEPLVGFVVSKAVGPAVVRNTVKRRLRHLLRERLTSLPGPAVLVVRALPPAATMSSVELGADLDRALARLRVRP